MTQINEIAVKLPNMHFLAIFIVFLARKRPINKYMKNMCIVASETRRQTPKEGFFSDQGPKCRLRAHSVVIFVQVLPQSETGTRNAGLAKFIILVMVQKRRMWHANQFDSCKNIKSQSPLSSVMANRVSYLRNKTIFLSCVLEKDIIRINRNTDQAPQEGLTEPQRIQS
jgi:hypothetical protein